MHSNIYLITPVADTHNKKYGITDAPFSKEEIKEIIDAQAERWASFSDSFHQMCSRLMVEKELHWLVDSMNKFVDTKSARIECGADDALFVVIKFKQISELCHYNLKQFQDTINHMSFETWIDNMDDLREYYDSLTGFRVLETTLTPFSSTPVVEQVNYTLQGWYIHVYKTLSTDCTIYPTPTTKLNDDDEVLFRIDAIVDYHN